MVLIANSFSCGVLNLHYKRVSNPAGAANGKALLLFHGFGGKEENLLTLAKKLADDYTCYCFTLPFHGNGSGITGKEALQPQDLAHWYEEFLKNEGYEAASLYGFSIGARFALTFACQRPELTNALYLAAPDGIAFEPIYYFATKTFIGQSIFRHIVAQPKPIFFFIRLLQSLGLMNRSLLRFVSNQMNTQPKRQLVYHSWMAFRHLGVNVKRLDSTCKNSTIPINLALGKGDKVIGKTKLSPYLKQIHFHKFLVLECGHYQLIDRSIVLFQEGK